VPKSCYLLGAQATFDRGASFCSLYLAPRALATSPRNPQIVGSKIILYNKKKLDTPKGVSSFLASCTDLDVDTKQFDKL
jgi:hypothetical protein